MAEHKRQAQGLATSEVSPGKLPKLEPAQRHDLGSDVVAVQFLCTNDTHSQMEPFKQAPYPEAIGGVARRARVFADMRGQVPATMAFDAGDLFTGTHFFDYLHGEAEMTVLHRLQYDASAIGNHDVDGSRSDFGDVSGWPFLKLIAAKYAPHVKMLCANVIDVCSGDPLFLPYATFQTAVGVKIGVTALLGEEAWTVTAEKLRPGFRYVDFLKAAEEVAAKLRAENCDVLICLSHTGVDRGDRKLAALGLYDVIFSGHAHYFDDAAVFEQVEGPGGRLGLLSKGFALGGGVCWARLQFDTKTRRVVEHASGVILVDGRCGENVEIRDMVCTWKVQLERDLGINEVLGLSVEHLPKPEKTEQAATFSPVHAALQDAIRQEFFAQVKEGKCSVTAPAPTEHVIVMTNAYSAKSSLDAGEVTRGTLKDLIRYNPPTFSMEVSGRFLAAIVERNALFCGSVDFLFMSGVSFTLRCHDESKNWPIEPLSRDEVQLGALECLAVNVAGADSIDKDGWYWCLLDEFVFETLLKDMPERSDGVRNLSPKLPGSRDLVEGYLRRGGRLRCACP